MKLSKVSSWFFLAVLFVLATNALFLVLIKQANDDVVSAQDHRSQALALANELHRETEQLARLVRTYTNTGESRYLLYYYDILGVRQGEKPAPKNFNSRTYWDDVIAGRIQHNVPKEGGKQSLSDLMKSQGFTETEFLALKEVIDGTEAMNKIEQIAFAATQGLYNPETREFESDGQPQLDFASKLVHGEEYNILKANLSQAVEGLLTMTDRRTRNEVASAGRRLERWILLSLLSIVGTIVLGVFASRVIRRKVLDPIYSLGKAADILATGDYATRIATVSGVEELTTLEDIFNSMAQAIEDDIGRRYALQKELEASRQQAEDATRAKSMFLANMSHELRTPLNAIIGYNEMLQEEAQDLGQESFIPDLQKIHSASKHLLQLINDILDLSKIEAGKMELFLETFSLATLIKEVEAVIRPLVEKNSNTFELRGAGDLGAMRADQTKMRQALFNLLSNASKFTERGAIVLAVERETVAGIEWISLRVTDSGIGLSPAQQAKLFQEFTQADASTTRKFGGTGLGLVISRRFCRMMGGDITVESSVGHGSTFTIRLPTEVIDLEIETASVVQTLPAVVLPSQQQTNTVLVIDDDPAMCDLLQRTLSKEGFRVVIASSGQEGLLLAKSLHPDVITLDVMMPEMDGWAVLAALKADPELADIPAIMLTMVDDKNLGYALGAADYLVKPVERERLVSILNNYRSAMPSGLEALVVDDESTSRDLLGRMLRKEGWTVHEAVNGREALRMMQNPPQLILLDLMMPEMDGFEFVEEFCRHQEWKAIPIVVVTAKQLTQEDRLRLKGSVKKVLLKGSYHIDQLLAEVRTLVKAAAQ